MLAAMRTPPALTSLRVSTARISRREALEQLRQELQSRGESTDGLHEHPSLPDVICLRASGPNALPSRPTRVIVVSCKCGEAVLRGAQVYAAGVVATSAELYEGDRCSVLVADATAPLGRGAKLSVAACRIALGLPPAEATELPPQQPRRPTTATHREGGRRAKAAATAARQAAAAVELLHVGDGVARMGRQALFGGQAAQLPPPKQLAVELCGAAARVYATPSLRDTMPHVLTLQNVPSAVAVHVLAPRRGERVLDMCAAPGGKATGLALLMCAHAAGQGGGGGGGSGGGDAALDAGGGSVLALDRSAARVAAMDALVARLGLGGVVRTRCLDATAAPKVLLGGGGGGSDGGEGLFDRVLLDPPCSALGLRPQLQQAAGLSTADLRGCAEYQRRLIDAAVALLRPGGTLVYSTCTTNPAENEENVGYALRAHPRLRLAEQTPRLGLPGLAGCGGLTAREAAMLQRFDPAAGGEASGADHIGFFVARFECAADVPPPPPPPPPPRAPCVVRAAVAADVGAIARCWHDGYFAQGGIDHLPRAFLAERTVAKFEPRALERIADILVACDARDGGRGGSRGSEAEAGTEAGAEVLGFCACVGDEVEQFFLSERARGTGVAALLMARAEALLRARGISQAHLYCFPGNARALRFYERCGWRRVHECDHDVQISGGRTHTLHLARLEKGLRCTAAEGYPEGA